MKSTEVDTKTGEVITRPTQAVAIAGPEPLSVAQMREMLATVVEYKEEILQDKVDYQVIPGTKKPSLLKAGAEKLAFAFNLSSANEIVSEIEDYFREWEYDKPVYRWEGKKKTLIRTDRVKARGFFAYKVKCTLSSKATGQPWADAIGEFSSVEKGREDAPANTILKMAEKRAYNAAVLNATFASGQFTQDMEDQQKGSPASPRAASGSSAATGGDKSELERTMPSKYGSEDKPSKCGFCGKHHILEGDLVGLSNKKWGAVGCHESETSTKPPDNEPPTGRVEAIMRQTKDDIQAQALELLNKLGGEDIVRGDEIFRQAVQDEIINEGQLAKNTKEQLTNLVIYLQDRVAAEAM